MDRTNRLIPTLLFLLLSLLLISSCGFAQKVSPKFKVVAFYTGQNDRAHVSFVYEANRWFSKTAGKYKFSYDSTNNWDNLNQNFLAKYDIVIFLDTRPDKPEQRVAF